MKAIYSCLFGQYDDLKTAPSFDGWDSVLFTNQEFKDSKGWIIKKVESDNELKDSRKYKWLSHKFLPEYDLVCYIDASMSLVKEPPNGPVWFTHPTRRKVLEEAQTLISLKRGSEEDIVRQMRFYTEKRFNDKFGLYANGFFVRSNRNEAINYLHEKTWEIIDKYSARDQLALPYAISITNVQPENIRPYNLARPFFTFHPHLLRFKEKEKVFVHHITPARSDKNFGKAINQLIEHLPENDWICLRDIDTVPTNHVDFIRQCEEIANRNDFDLISCMTNRLGLPYQLVNGVINESMNFGEHMGIGKDLAEKFGSEVVKSPNSIGGVMMLFSKKTWLAIGKVPEGGIVLNGAFVDYHICKAIYRLRLKIGIAKGIYLWHTYRLGLDGQKHLH